MIAHTFNPSTSTREQRRQISERKASLGYKESSRIARAVRQRNPVSKIMTMTTTKWKGTGRMWQDEVWHSSTQPLLYACRCPVLETVLGRLVPSCDSLLPWDAMRSGSPRQPTGTVWQTCPQPGIPVPSLPWPWSSPSVSLERFLYIEKYRFKEAWRPTTLPWLQSPGTFKTATNRSSLLKLLGLLAESTFCSSLNLFFVYRFVFY